MSSIVSSTLQLYRLVFPEPNLIREEEVDIRRFLGVVQRDLIKAISKEVKYQFIDLAFMLFTTYLLSIKSDKSEITQPELGLKEKVVQIIEETMPCLLTKLQKGLTKAVLKEVINKHRIIASRAEEAGQPIHLAYYDIAVVLFRSL